MERRNVDSLFFDDFFFEKIGLSLEGTNCISPQEILRSRNTFNKRMQNDKYGESRRNPFFPGESLDLEEIFNRKSSKC